LTPKPIDSASSNATFTVAIATIFGVGPPAMWSNAMTFAVLVQNPAAPPTLPGTHLTSTGFGAAQGSGVPGWAARPAKSSRGLKPRSWPRSTPRR